MKTNIPIAVVVFIAATLSISAQVAAIESPVCNAQFAQQLVQQPVIEGKSVTDPVKRIKVLLRSADFLWKFDEPTARSYFSEAWKIADDRFKELGFESKQASDSKLTTILPDQRMEVVRAIAKKDAVWSKKLSEQMLTDFDKSAANRKDFDQTRELADLLALARESVETNPELSRYLFRRVMKYPLFNHWFFVFFGIPLAQQAFTESLYQETLNNYRNESPRRLLMLSAYPFANERIFGIDKYSISMGPPSSRPNPQLQRHFLDVFFSRIARYAASAEEMNQAPEKGYPAEPIYMVSALREMEPLVVQQLPDMLERLSIAKSQAAALLSAEMNKQMEEKDKAFSGEGFSFDERIADMEKSDGTGKLTDYMVLNLVRTAKSEEQFAQVPSWIEKVKDDKARIGLTNYFWFLRAKLAIKEKRWEDADKFTAKVPEAEHRAVLMFEMAELQSKNEGDLSSLFETLNRLSKVTRSAENSVSKAQVLLGLANMYEKVSHSVAIDELSEAIRVTNNLKDPDIFSTMVRREITGKDFSFFASFGTPGYDLEKTFVDLSKKDFEMSLTSARTLEDRYLRTLAVIAVASTCAKNTKPGPKAGPKVQSPPRQ